METETTRQMPRPRVGSVIIAVFCLMTAMGGGFTAGWVSHEQASANDAEQRAERHTFCLLDVLIEPPDRAAPEIRYDVWTVERLADECGITPSSAVAIRD